MAKITLDVDATKKYIETQWTASVIPTLKDYIRIDNTSTSYGYNDAKAQVAANLLCDWVNSYKIPGIKAVVRQSNKPQKSGENSLPAKRTPIILVVVEPTKSSC
jgi:hypothetical protein